MYILGSKTAAPRDITYGVASISRLLKFIDLFCRIVSFVGLFRKGDGCTARHHHLLMEWLRLGGSFKL